MTGTPIDGHVHFHASFSLTRALDYARQNFRAIGANTAALLVAHVGSGDPLALLRDATLSAGWKSEPADATSLILSDDEDTKLVAIAGRQTVTREKLELLTLGSNADVGADLPLPDAIASATDAGAVPVVPWGFGKWWFGRGQVLGDLVNATNTETWLIGDNGCRPSVWNPSMFRHAKAHNVGYLAGSDPLPLRSHETRIGAFGSIAPTQIDLSQPTEWIRSVLLEQTHSFPSFGRCRTMGEFLTDQLSLRVAKKTNPIK